MDLHPHNNPIYKGKLIKALNLALKNNQLVMIENDIDRDYNNEMSKVKQLFYRTTIGSAFLAYYLDKRYIKPTYGERLMPRISYALILIISGSIIPIKLRDNSRYYILAERLAFKYENQLRRLHPKLQIYWFVHKHSSAFLPPKNIAPIYPNQKAPDSSNSKGPTSGEFSC